MSTAARVRTDPRISRRRRAIERSRRRRLLSTIAVVAAVAGLVWIAFWSPLLRVDDIVVIGGAHVTPEEVGAIASLDESDNLLLVSTAAIADKVEELPWVREAKVNRKLPGTVRVKIVERRPAVVLSLASARWTLDARGNVLTEGAVGEALPVLAGVPLSSVAAGERSNAPELTDALAAWRSLSKRLKAEVVAILAPSPERITLSLASGTQIRFGAAESLEAKNEVLEALLAEMRAEGTVGGYIDVRVPASPAIGPSTAAANSDLAPSPSPSAP